MASVISLLRFAHQLHGHAAWLAAALLWHPVFVLRPAQHARSTRVRSLRVAWLATAVLTLVFGTGIALYGAYRDTVRTPLFQEARAIGLLFERKEHLAFAALMLAWIGALRVTHVWRDGPQEATNEGRGAGDYGGMQAARVAFALSALFATICALIGTLVASVKPL